MFTAGSPDLAAQPAAAAVSSQPAVTPLDEQAVAVSSGSPPAWNAPLFTSCFVPQAASTTVFFGYVHPLD